MKLINRFRLLKISRKDEITNINIYDRVEEKRTTLLTTRRRHPKLIGHVLRHTGLLADILKRRKAQSKRKRERSRLNILDHITQEARLKTLMDLKITVVDKEKWEVTAEGNQSTD